MEENWSPWGFLKPSSFQKHLAWKSGQPGLHWGNQISQVKATLEAKSLLTNKVLVPSSLLTPNL